MEKQLQHEGQTENRAAMDEDIIAAAATAWGYGGIAIVRLSGRGCTAAADALYLSKGGKKLSEVPARYMSLGSLRTRDGETFDEVLAVRFEPGKSYTGEEAAEIHCHGGLAAAGRCIAELCAHGVRLAAPGEFTRRAFVNGRIDLTQAEAVAGIIKARSDEALAASARTLQGELTGEIKKLMAGFTELAAALEVDLDFPEEGEGFISDEECISKLRALSEESERLCSRCRCGILLRDGLRVAITGTPNVGKSSLLNALLERDRAIVAASPGTTRDSIEETFICGGLPVRIIDTAGIRDTDDEIEAIGVSRSLRSIEEADIVLRVLDGAKNAETAAMPHVEKPQIVVLNKSDLPCRTSVKEAEALFPGSPVLPVSAKDGSGIDELKELILRTAASGADVSRGYSVSARQFECISHAKEAADAALAAIAAGAGDDAVLSCISEGRAQLAAMLGADAGEELLDKIFGDFCVGK